ncbi:hypothetical protein LAWI1_G001971 [Lachnellula willkommii]|uniref:Uncharacterized protein n=1 Tax=Lachnellula willkommii TaxID=215461 RepID=A0A559MMP5_9HELO|nr:hypothetical protein LAWI1_G001971 [Lachnellula willkommii]
MGSELSTFVLSRVSFLRVSRICEGNIPRGDYIFEVARSYSEKSTTSSRLESFNIEYLVQRLRMSDSIVADVKKMIGEYESKIHEASLYDIMHNAIPVSFSSIEDAKNVFEHGRCQFASTQAAVVSCDPIQFFDAVEARTDQNAALLSKFSLALQALVDSKGPSLTPKEDIAIAVLQLHVLYSYVSLNLEQLPSNNPSLRDAFLPQFQEMVLLGEKIISSMLLGSNNRTITYFCLDMGILIPLYAIANPITRRKAITLLRSTSRQEGLWNSLLVAKAAERVVEIEESALAGLETSTGSLDWAEASSVQPFLELDAKGGRLLYSQLEQRGSARLNVVEEVFTW